MIIQRLQLHRFSKTHAQSFSFSGEQCAFNCTHNVCSARAHTHANNIVSGPVCVCVCCIYRFFFCARRSRDPLLEQNVLCLCCTTHQHFSILSPALRQPRSLFDRLPMCAASVVRRAVFRAPPPVRTLLVRRATKRSADPLCSRTMKPAIAVRT